MVWDRSIDKDIVDISDSILSEPTLIGYQFPSPVDPRYFANIESEIALKPDLFRIFEIGFSLYERARTLRGIDNLLLDFCENPRFVNDLLDAICEYNTALIEKALKYDALAKSPGSGGVPPASPFVSTCKFHRKADNRLFARPSNMISTRFFLETI